jgi:hypothetical protein
VILIESLLMFEHQRTLIVLCGDLPGLETEALRFGLASIIPCTRNLQDRVSAIVTAATRDCVLPGQRTTSIRVQGSEKSEGAIAGLNFECDRHTENQTAGGKCSWLDDSCAEARRVESRTSGDRKTAIRACDIALSDFAHHIERLFRGIGEDAAQVVTDVPNVDAGERSVIARVTSAVDFVCPVEGFAREIPGENDHLSVYRRGGERCTGPSHSTRETDGG